MKAALGDYVKTVRAAEPGTYMYTASVPDMEGASFPPVSPDRLIFNSSWKDHAAFLEHGKGAPYREFLARHGHLFVQALGEPTTTQPYMTTAVLKRCAGFFRPEAFST